MKRTAISAVFLGSIFVGAVLRSYAKEVRRDKPNVLTIMADDYGVN